MGKVELSDLKSGESAMITGIYGTDEVALRLLDLGFLEGRVVSVRHLAPFGGTVAVEVAGTIVALGPEEARHIRVEKKEILP